MKIFRTAAMAVGTLLFTLGATAQTLNMAKALDSPHYDSQRTTWSPTSDVTHMIQDTLVALDWDGKTAVPLLAKMNGAVGNYNAHLSAWPRLPSAFSKSIGLTLCGMVLEPTSPGRSFCLK